MKRSLVATLGLLGPGFAVAATGIGAGDVVAAAVSGAQFGVAVVWAALVGAVLKYVLNEGIARWQLATGTTLLEGWGAHLHRFVIVGFVAYLVLWSFIVAGALIAACGLAAHAIAPGVSVRAWGVVHSFAAVALVMAGRYMMFERLMKALVAFMFVTVVICAGLVDTDWSAVTRGLFTPSIPAQSGPLLLGMIGGVGGSVTLLSYSYWIRERGWTGAENTTRTRIDLAAAYLLTGLFGVAIVVIAAGVQVEAVTGNTMALAIATRVGEAVGPVGKWMFLFGFWGAVFTSMLGVWQGVPYIFADAVRTLRSGTGIATQTAATDTRSALYRGYLLFMALPPMLLLIVDRPVWIVILYSVTGAFFMPFLAATLLYLNNSITRVRHLRNGIVVNTFLVFALLLFGYLCVNELATRA